jgi:hypothetical protein
MAVDYTKYCDFNNVYTFVVNRGIYKALLPQNEIKQKTELLWVSFGQWPVQGLVVG